MNTDKNNSVILAISAEHGNLATMEVPLTLTNSVGRQNVTRRAAGPYPRDRQR